MAKSLIVNRFLGENEIKREKNRKICGKATRTQQNDKDHWFMHSVSDSTCVIDAAAHTTQTINFVWVPLLLQNRKKTIKMLTNKNDQKS